jgi:UDP-N-acetylmuramoyl-tripeptide--D-alanyl-D-alanine ligase
VEAVFSGDEILEIAMGRLVSGLMPDESGAISTDTRNLKEGQWFVALPGRTFDGHDFLGDAFAGGALGCIVAERHNYAIASNSFPVIAVDDTTTALANLARTWLSTHLARVLLICGEEPDVQQLVPLIEAIARAGDADISSLGMARSVDEICTALFRLTRSSEFIVAGLNPLSLEAIEAVGKTLRPALVVFGSWTFANLRLVNSAQEILNAKLRLAQLTEGSNKIALCGAQEESLLSALQSQGDLELFAWPQDDSSGRSSRQLQTWQSKLKALTGIAIDYIAVLEDAALLMGFEQAWICVTIGALIGIKPETIATVLRRECSREPREFV